MQFQIRQIVLWPKDASKEPRIVNFQKGRLNIISGVSRTGKSALIPIIDYCLGADRCTIPTGIIRQKTAWFGIVVATEEGEKLFARREPGLRQATDDMAVFDAQTIEVPVTITKNSSRDSVKQILDHLAGLTKLSFSINPSGPDLGRPSFRDLAAFIFQPQNVVANPNVLFYKADTVEHRQKLRSIFPYVLGAVNAETLGRQHELLQLERELRRKEFELTAVKGVSERWRATLKARYSEAKDLGLFSRDEIEPLNETAMLQALSAIAQTERPDPHVTLSTVGEAVDEVNRLSVEESEVSEVLSTARRRYSEMEQLRANAAQFGASLDVQRDRLEISKWLSRHSIENHDCPVCGSAVELPLQKLDELVGSLSKLEQTSQQFEHSVPSFDRELQRVRSVISVETERLEGIRIRQNSLTKQSAEARAQHYGMLAASRFLGKLESDLSTYVSVSEDGVLEAEVSRLRARVMDLKRLVSGAEIAARMKRAIESVDLYAGRMLPHLDVEERDDPIHLDTQELTIKVTREERNDFLWEVGSGSNWLSYHVAMALALQDFFTSIESCPVPSFIVFDQPSQVYFPRRLAGGENEENLQEDWRDQDVEAVHKVLDVMASAVKRAKGKLQILVLDHASELVWGDIQDVYPAEDWRDGRALIPANW